MHNSRTVLIRKAALSSVPGGQATLSCPTTATTMNGR